MRACLLCKILTTKAIPRDVFRSQVPKLLQLVGSVNIEIVGSNTFILEFSSMVDRKRVLTNGPWNLFRNLMLFSEIRENTSVSDVTFSNLDLWVQVHNVPLSCMNMECAELIGN